MDGKAYFARAVSCTCIMIMKLTTGANDIKKFTSSLMLWTNKLERLLSGKPFQPGLKFVGKAGSLHWRVMSKRCSTWTDSSLTRKY